MAVWFPESPSADEVRQTAREVIARPEYQLDSGLDENSRSLMSIVLSWLIKPFLWLFEAMGGLPTTLKLIIIIGLVALLIALVAHIIYTIVVAVSGSKKTVSQSLRERDQQADPATLEQSALEKANDGRYTEGIRLLLKAVLLRIEHAEKSRMKVGITNRELLRRYRDSALAEPLSTLIDTVDRTWYGLDPCHQGEFETCQTQHATACEIIRRRQHALGS